MTVLLALLMLAFTIYGVRAFIKDARRYFDRRAKARHRPDSGNPRHIRDRQAS